MSKRKLAPQLGDISAEDFKKRRRRIKVLTDQRLAYGKGTFFNTDNHKERYPIDEISAALVKALKIANKINKHLELSTEEKNLWAQIFRVGVIIIGACLLIFLIDWDGDGTPDILQFLKHNPDWIEKSLGLPDGEIEKRLGLPTHEIEKDLGRGDSVTPASRQPEI